MTKEQQEISDAYRSLFGLSPTTTQNEEESPEDGYSRLIKRITDGKQHYQELKDKRTSILAETPEFRKILKTYEDFIRNPQYQFARLLKGCQTYSLTQEDKERVLLTSAPDGELRIAHGFSRSPVDLTSGICVADRPNPSFVYCVPISQGEVDAVEALRKFDWKIVCVEREISSLEVELRGCRVKALVAGTPLTGEPRETAPSESADEQPLAEVSASEEIVGRSVDHEAGEGKEAGPKKLVREPGRKSDAEKISVLEVTNESVPLSNSPQDGEGKDKSGSAERRNAMVREFLQKQDWEKANLKKHKWKLRPLMKKIDDGAIPLLRGKRYENYESYCHLFDDAKKYRSFYGVGAEEASGDDQPEFNDSCDVYDYLIENLSRGVYPRRKKR